MATKVNKKVVIVGVSAVALLLIGVAVWWFFFRAKPAPTPAEPVELPPKTDPPPVGPTVPPAPKAPNGYEPKTTPIQGEFYAVKKGDSVDSILRAAGYTAPQIYNVKYAMTHDPENEWVGREGTVGLRLYQRFEPQAGEALGQTWAYKTAFGPASSSRRRWPVVRIPLPGEVQA